MEENSLIGGFGSLVTSYYRERGLCVKIKCFGAEDGFVEHATVESQIEKHGIGREQLAKAFDQ